MENKSQILIYDDGLQPKTSAGMIKLHECICKFTTVHKQDFVKKIYIWKFFHIPLCTLLYTILLEDWLVYILQIILSCWAHHLLFKLVFIMSFPQCLPCQISSKNGKSVLSTSSSRYHLCTILLSYCRKIIQKCSKAMSYTDLADTEYLCITWIFGIQNCVTWNSMWDCSNLLI